MRIFLCTNTFLQCSMVHIMINKEENIMNKKDFSQLINLLNDLEWDHDRLSSSGQETLNEIWRIIYRNSEKV